MTKEGILFTILLYIFYSDLADAIDIYFWLKIRILCVGVLNFKRLLILHTRNLLNWFLSTNHLLNLCSRAVNSKKKNCSEKSSVCIKGFCYTKYFFMFSFCTKSNFKLLTKKLSKKFNLVSI